METIDRIKHEAYILFAENGYAGTSMRDIANKVGIKAASIYSHYKSKEDLFIDLFKDCISEYDKGVSLNDDHIDIPLEEKMLELLRVQVLFLEENPHLLKFLARNIFFPPVELKDKLQSIIEDNLNITNMKNYYEIYDVLKKDKKIKNEITIDRFISTFDMCIIRYFIGKIGLNYYKEQETIESLFNSYWEEMQS